MENVIDFDKLLKLFSLGLTVKVKLTSGRITTVVGVDDMQRKIRVKEPNDIWVKEGGFTIIHD